MLGQSCLVGIRILDDVEQDLPCHLVEENSQDFTVFLSEVEARIESPEKTAPDGDDLPVHLQLAQVILRCPHREVEHPPDSSKMATRIRLDESQNILSPALHPNWGGILGLRRGRR